MNAQAAMVVINFALTAGYILQKAQSQDLNGKKVCCPGVLPRGSKTITTMLTSCGAVPPPRRLRIQHAESNPCPQPVPRPLAGMLALKLTQYVAIANESLAETLGQSALHKLPLTYNVIDADHVGEAVERPRAAQRGFSLVDGRVLDGASSPSADPRAASAAVKGRAKARRAGRAAGKRAGAGQGVEGEEAGAAAGTVWTKMRAQYDAALDLAQEGLETLAG